MLGRRALLVIPLVFIMACGQTAAPARSGQPSGAAPAAVSQDRTVTMAVRYEPPSLVPKAGSGLTGGAVRPFNAALFFVDGDGKTQPYLTAAVPQLNSDTWRVQPDGRMEVTYQLRPNLTWHDGQPLTADDVAFAYRVYANPASGMFPPTPQNLMDGVEVRDPLTFVIAFNRPYPDAANFPFGDFEPLPRHVLEEAFHVIEQDPSQQDGFRTNPFFAQKFV